MHTMPHPQPLDINIYSPTYTADPYRVFTDLRQNAPVHPVRMPDGWVVWFVSRYDDVAAALKDERLVKDAERVYTAAELGTRTDFDRLFNRHLLNLDPPDHTRLRALIQKAFTPRIVEAMRPRIETLANALIDDAQARGTTMDLIADYAFPLPVIIIAELLGAPPSDRDRFKAWSHIVVGEVDWNAPDVRREQHAFIDYLRALFDARRAVPQDDLISALLSAEQDGSRLSQEELYAMVILLLVAGHETTVNLIGNGTLALLTHPAELDKLRADPSLMRGAVEELLRFNGPVVHSTLRFAAADVPLGGAVIPRGAPVLVLLGAANHDPAHFDNAEGLDISRDESRHLAFGLGAHYCVGAPLARLEGEIALRTLLTRLPNLRLTAAPESLAWKPNMILRGLEALPVAF